MVKGENLMSLEKNFLKKRLLQRRFLVVAAITALSLAPAFASAQTNWPWSPMTWARVDQMIEREFPGVPSITTTNLADLLKAAEPRLIIDVRDLKEFSVSHIEGAVHADSLSKIQAAIDSNPNVKKVVLYCSVGLRSAKYVQQLRQKNKNDMFNLKGSLFAWANEGKPIFSGNTRVFKVHPYDTKWGELLKLELRAPL
jgi:rhodanese-related sulfurtransferase